MNPPFKGLDLEQLLTWLRRSEGTGSFFGIPESLFFTPAETDRFRMHRYGLLLETPVGVAAGPHTQLAQNIICAWLTGARYIELKTVQILDEIEVTKPCINMEDEGYNCEWSQELKIEQSAREYVNALVGIHVLKKRLKIGDADVPGFLFNMSVGYNLEGILSPKVQWFLDTMANTSSLVTSALEVAQSVFPDMEPLHIPSRISDSITLSTMHGCPPDEIEKIALYFIEQRKLNTTIKLNPTLLGPDDTRHILNDCLGFDMVVPDIAFEHDLKYADGIGLITRLREKAAAVGVAFNIKLTNTLETENTMGKLPGSEKMVYMSGRALHAVSIHLAARLQKAFNGGLDISFSAGADCFNLPQILSCGLAPVTMCSDLLKPGGYGRMRQYLTRLEEVLADHSCAGLSEYVLKTAPGCHDEKSAILENLDRYAAVVIGQAAYRKKSFPWSTIKTGRKLESFDCIHAPCVDACPAGQDVPSYMAYTARGEFDKALEVILETNPFPHVQGLVCDHPCTEKCTRMNYDAPLLIREIKRFIAQQASKDLVLPVPGERNGLKAAVIGGGPSGFSAAWFLRMNGFGVDLFEAKPFPGGMAADAIPCFRLDHDSIEKDINRIMSLGVTVHYNRKVDTREFDRIRQAFDYVYIAVGACRALSLEIPGVTAAGVLDPLAFLSAVRRGRPVDIGKNIVVIGGGNSAMDVSRTAKRLAGKDGNITILYRRAVSDMPAAREEIEEAAIEGITIIPMAAPARVLTDKDGRVSGIEAHRTTPGDPDASGRSRPVIIEDSRFEIAADTIIPAIGQQVVIPFRTNTPFKVNPDTFQTDLDRVYAGGDAIRGASTLIRAIADGRKAVENMARHAGLALLVPMKPCRNDNLNELETAKAIRIHPEAFESVDPVMRSNFDLAAPALTRTAAQKEASRCLLCDALCDICVTVCPNRANLAYEGVPFSGPVFTVWPENQKAVVKETGTLTISQSRQVINIADFCNECGNCNTFCPSSGAPYRDKPRFYLSGTLFDSRPSGYHISGNSIHEKINGGAAALKALEDGYSYETDLVTALFDKEGRVRTAGFKKEIATAVDLAEARKLIFLYESLKDLLPDGDDR